MQLILAGGSGQDDVVDGDKDQLDDVADGAHHDEAHEAGLQDLEVLFAVRLLALVPEVLTVAHELVHLVNLGLLLAAFACHNTYFYF